MFTTKAERDKSSANFARAQLGSQLLVQRRSRKWPSDRLRTSIEQVAHRGAVPLDNCHTRPELHKTKSDAGPVFLSWFGGLVIWRQKPKLFTPGGMIQLPLGDELLVVSRAAPICARETRCTENRRFLGPAIPPPAPTPRCAGTSGDRPDLPADDWTAPSAAELVSQRAKSGRSSALSRLRAQRCEAIALSDNKIRKRCPPAASSGRLSAPRSI